MSLLMLDIVFFGKNKKKLYNLESAYFIIFYEEIKYSFKSITEFTIHVVD